MRRSCPLCFAAVLGATVLLWSAVSTAEPEDDEARERFERGLVLVAEGELEMALSEFRASYGVRAVPVVLYNIGVVQRELHRYADAAVTLRRYLESTVGVGEPPERREAVREILAALEAVLGRVAFDIEPLGAHVFVDGELEGQAPLTRPLRIVEGEHDLEVRRDGYHTHRETFVVAGREELDLSVRLEALPPTTPWYRRWWLWTAVGVAVVGVVVAIAVPLSIDADQIDLTDVRLQWRELLR